MLKVSDYSQAVWMSSKLGFYLGSSLWKLKWHSQPSCTGWLRHNLRNGQSFMLNSHHEGIHNSKRSQYENLIMMKINLQEPDERRYC